MCLGVSFGTGVFEAILEEVEEIEGMEMMNSASLSDSCDTSNKEIKY